MQIVIDIPEETYRRCCVIADLDGSPILKAIKNGTPLPKGHGELIDKNEITAFGELECNGHNVESLNEFTTIIEADESESEVEREG